MGLKDNLFGVGQPQAQPVSPVPAAGPAGAVTSVVAPQPVTDQPVYMPSTVQKTTNVQGWVILGLVVLVYFLGGMMIRLSLQDSGADGEDSPKVKGLHVLVVYESDLADAAAADTSTKQRIAMGSVRVHKWLDENCVKVQDAPAWRMLDKDTPMNNEEPVWKSLMAKKRDKLPWLYMTGGKREISQPMVDGGADAFIEQLQKGLK